MLATTTLRHHRPNQPDLRNADPSRRSLFYRVGGLVPHFSRVRCARNADFECAGDILPLTLAAPAAPVITNMRPPNAIQSSMGNARSVPRRSRPVAALARRIH